MSRRAMMIRPATGGGGLTYSTITTDHTKAGGSDTADFVMWFNSTDARWKSTGNGGQVGTINDFRFATDSGGLSLLTWQIIAWDQTTGQLRGWVNLGTVSHTVDVVRYLLWDDTGRSLFLGGNPWDANYLTVPTIGDGSTLDWTDLTSNANNGTAHNGPTAIAGPNGLGAASFTAASSQWMDTPNTINCTHFTLETLVRVSGAPGGSPSGLIGGLVQGNGAAVCDHLIAVRSDLAPYVYVYDGAEKFAASSVLTAGTWYYLAGGCDGATEFMSRNATNLGTTVAGNAYAGYTGHNFQIGGFSLGGTGGGNPTQYYTFDIALARFSNVARSSDYLTATYNSINSPSTFYTLA